MRSIFTTFFITTLLVFVLGTNIVHAGFGVTPPYFRNTSLTRNSTYEQQILLVRGDPTRDLKASVIIDAPEIADWITVVEGDSFILPRGEQKVPMTIRVQVPNDADFKNYAGAIRVKTGSVDGTAAGGGGVNISLGAQIDVDLNVIDKVIEDFRIRKISISDLNEGHKLGWLYFPGKIKFGMKLENTGNVDVAPSSVRFKIYDHTGTILLEDTDNRGKIKKIIPYATETVVADIPTRLPAGNYLARYEIYNNESVKQEGEINVNIRPYGTVQSAGFGFSGLSLPHKVSIILPILSVLALLVFVVHLGRERRRKKKQ